MIRLGWVLPLLLVLLAIGCDGSSTRATQTPSPSPTATPTRVIATVTATPSMASTPTPTSEPVLQDIRVTRLRIPSLGIDADVQGSRAIPDTGTVAPGCPAKPPGQETLTVPTHGIATPEEAFTGLENKAWIYGHSRWQGEPGLFFVLQDIDVGDELFVDGLDRQTGEEITDQRYVVEGIYLTDTSSGGTLVTAQDPAEIPMEPTVILQTSVRERGADRPWILDQEKVLARAETLIEGDVDDPCKYLLLFVIARSS